MSRDCSGAVCDRELKFGMTDSPIQAGHNDPFSFSCQVRLLTYDVISKPPDGDKMPQLCNAAIEGNIYLEADNYSDNFKK